MHLQEEFWGETTLQVVLPWRLRRTSTGGGTHHCTDSAWGVRVQVRKHQRKAAQSELRQASSG
jgi:hypothetical protein